MSIQGKDLETLRRALASLCDEAAPREDCPEPALLFEAVRGETEPATLRGVLDHLASCAACRCAWRLALETARAEPAQSLEAAPELAPLAPGRGLRPIWAAAAAAVVAAGVGWMLWSERASHAPLEPPDSGEPAESSVFDQPGFRGDESEIRSLVPETLPRDDCRLKWQGLEGAVYELRVMHENLDVVIARPGIEATEFLIPEAALEGIDADAPLLWRLVATTPEGQRVPSATFALRLE